MCEVKVQKVLQDEQCFEIIRKKLQQEAMDGFSLINYEIVPINEVNGYMGQYFTLKAIVAKSPFETKSINFFTKIPPPINSPMYNYSQLYGTFKKEVALYTTVFPEMLNTNDLDKRYIPECFLGIENDVIVLEDMAHSGYKMTDKSTPFDFEHCEILMKTLAKFHAKSFIFEQQYKKTLHDEFSHCMHETLWPADDRAKAMFDASVKGIVSMIDLLPGLNDDQRSNFKEKIVKLCVDHMNKLSPSIKHKNVLCHGDLWANNILFKYDDKKPIECCLIDFQLARYNPPAHDILCFLQFTTTRKLREKHNETLFRIYYDSMAIVMKEADLNISDIFSWDEFVESIQDLRIMCIIHGILNTPIMLLKPEAASKYFSEEPEHLENILYVDRTPLICGQFKEVPEYRARMIDGLLELYDYIIDNNYKMQ